MACGLWNYATAIAFRPSPSFDVLGFVYPRRISVLRPVPQSPTNGGPSGAQASQFDTGGFYFAPSAAPSDGSAAGEQTILTDVPCSIQGLGGRTNPMGEVPTDAPGPARWKVFIPFSVVPKDTIKRRDILLTDNGDRLQVSVDYWNVLGWRLEAVTLEN